MNLTEFREQVSDNSDALCYYKDKIIKTVKWFGFKFCFYLQSFSPVIFIQSVFIGVWNRHTNQIFSDIILKQLLVYVYNLLFTTDKSKFAY